MPRVLHDSKGFTHVCSNVFTPRACARGKVIGCVVVVIVVVVVVVHKQLPDLGI